jgi:hypothetical protein
MKMTIFRQRRFGFDSISRCGIACFGNQRRFAAITAFNVAARGARSDAPPMG